MPIYEYSCAKCGKVIEVIQKFSDKPLKKHEKCGGALTKLISASAFHLKGTGWYKTDYASPAAKEDTSNGNKDKETKTETAEKSPASSDASSAGSKSNKKDKPPKSSASKN